MTGLSHFFTFLVENLIGPLRFRTFLCISMVFLSFPFNSFDFPTLAVNFLHARHCPQALSTFRHAGRIQPLSLPVIPCALLLPVVLSRRALSCPMMYSMLALRCGRSCHAPLEGAGPGIPV